MRYSKKVPGTIKERMTLTLFSVSQRKRLSDWSVSSQSMLEGLWNREMHI